MSLNDLIARLQEVLRGGPALRLAILFGSTARGTQTPASDVDIAILPLDELELQARLSVAAGREVDLVLLDTCTTVLGFRIAKEGIALCGDAVDVNLFRARAAIEYADIEPQLRQAEQRFLERLQRGPARAGES
jgi:predicted nucleotidyltransferase